jgi:hypothetical protein
MDRSHDITAAPDYVAIGGTQYEIRPLRWRDFGEAEKWMLKEKGSALDFAIARLKDVPPEMRQHLLDLGWKEQLRGEWLTRDQVIFWLTENYIGRLFAFWCMIRQAQPTITMDEAARLNEQEMEEARQALKQPIEPDLGLPQGNLPGRTRNGEAQPSPGVASAAA